MNDQPAFPQHDRVVKALSIENSQGMTLRDYFAAKALPVVMPDNRAYPSDAAKAAYQFADAMMEARK
jgi:hypothetical protein